VAELVDLAAYRLNLQRVLRREKRDRPSLASPTA
jgi:hypothetical protein